MRLVIFVLLSFSCAACVQPAQNISFDEVARVRSLDGRADALLVETNGQGPSTCSYLVFVVPPGVKLKWRDEKYLVASLRGAIRNDRACGVNLKWSSKEKLSIEHLRATSSQVIEPQINFAGYDVSIDLKSGVEDLSAPPGGMRYNLKQQTSAEK